MDILQVLIWCLLLRFSCCIDETSEQYVGCYRYHSNGYLRYIGNRGTISKCMTLCAENDNTYAGIQYGKWCYCGDAYGDYAVSLECYTSPDRCRDDQTSVCGTYYTFSVYKACPIGTWGRECEQSCPECSPSGCHVETGSCLTECPLGHRRVSGACVQGCLKGRYGPGCKHTCPSDCPNNICDPRLGYCLEPCGYSGPFCTGTCQSVSINAVCPFCAHCKDSVCDGSGSNCFKMCQRNWTGGTCKACDDGLWGSRCEQNCSTDCLENTCHLSSGHCNACLNGYHGDFCNLTCPENCLNSTCERDGICSVGCVEGFHSSFCNKSCSSGCIHNTCHWMNGTCSEGCSEGYFKAVCDEVCDNCNDGCEQNTGACLHGCKPGWTGTHCLNECMEGRFGLNCNDHCHCKSNNSCDPRNGHCSTGCLAGYAGSNCSLFTMEQDPADSSVLIPVVVSVCIAVVIVIVIVAVLAIRRRTQQSHTKPSGSTIEASTDDNVYANDLNMNHYDEIPEIESTKADHDSSCARTLTETQAVGAKHSPKSQPQPSKAESTEGLADRKKHEKILPLQLKTSKGQQKKNTKKNKSTAVSSHSLETAPKHEIKKDTVDSKPAIKGPRPLKKLAKVDLKDASVIEKPSIKSLNSDMKVTRLDSKDDFVESDTEDIYENTGVKAKSVETRIPLEALAAHIALMEETNGFEDEYHSLNKGQRAPWKIAEKPELRCKNRFRGIMAYDHSRVVLPVINGDPLSDYINACYMPNYTKEKAFIAAQGPTKAMIDDFWRMIWEQEVTAIVMVTNLEEDGKMKCELYWPESNSSSMKFGNMSIHLEKEDKKKDYTIRSLRVQQDGCTRNIIQFHFTSWPDHNVPQQPTALLNLLLMVKEHVDNDVAPVLVHCSAGIGRTGTYIAVDYLLDKAACEGVVDVKECINRLREYRIGMVQNKLQYAFTHKVILEGVMVGKTTLTKEEAISFLMSDEASNPSSIDLQYKFLDQHKHTSQTKQHFDANISPKSVGMPCDVFCQSKGSPTFLVKRYPQDDEVHDFWKLAREENVTVICLFDCPVNNNGWLPSEKPISLPQLTVRLAHKGKHEFTVELEEPTAEYVNVACEQDEVEEMYMNVGETKHTRFVQHGKQTVKILQLTLLTPKELCKLYSLAQTGLGDGKCMVLTKAENSQAGVCIASLTILSDMERFEEANVFDVIRHLRGVNQAIIVDRNEYRFFYEVLQHFVESMNH